GLEAAPAWTVSGPNAGDAFGSAVASAGDLNADGYADVIIGAPGADGTAQYGRAYAYLGSASGLATAPAWSVTGDQAGAKLGFSVACAGDVDGDGHSDVIVGAPLYDHPENDEGVAFVYFGFAGGIVGPGYLLESDDAGAQFGFSVGSAGDTNGDGYADVVIGAPYYGSTDQGHAELYRGAPVGSSLVLAKTWTAQHPQAWFGWSVGGADFDQDGLGDVVVGSPGVDNGQEDEGQVWAYRAPFDTNPWFGTDGNIAFGYHGKSLATGDVSGDGFPDILAGAPGQVGQASGSGIAHLWPGNGMWNGGTTNPTIGEGRPRQLLAYTSNLTAVVPLLGAVSGSQMRFGGYLSSPLGRDRIRLEVEVKPLDVAFDGTGTIFSTWADTGEPQAEGSRVFTTLLSPSLNPGAYHWRARLLGERPYWKRSPWIYPTRSTASEMDFRRRMNVSSVETGDVPSLQLAAYPSVFRGATTLRFEQPRTGPAVLRICDASGREVARPVDGILVAGTHQIAWDPGQVGRDVPNGIYFALFDSGSGHATTKLIRVR
ncbi:MAG: FG-GAP repeat protein, partial [Candidatus Eisenbacteria bacterium]|nr:FG-GAP repeat protein [Candidatus Eisenbacteria bacterium]